MDEEARDRSILHTITVSHRFCERLVLRKITNTNSPIYALFCPLDRLCTRSSSSIYVPPFGCSSDLSGVSVRDRCDWLPGSSCDLVLELVADKITVMTRCAAPCSSGRRAGSAVPMSATLGSTCDGIQNVVPYTSNCGGTRVLISYASPGTLSSAAHCLSQHALAYI